MPLQNSGMDIKDMKIGTRISTETVFKGPATDLFLNGDFDLGKHWGAKLMCPKGDDCAFAHVEEKQQKQDKNGKIIISKFAKFASHS